MIGYTNESTPEMLSLNYLDKLTNDTTCVYTFKGSLLNLIDKPFEHKHFVLTGWNSKNDLSGTSYPLGSMLFFTDSIYLYSKWDMVVNMEKDATEKLAVNMPEFITSAKVFDDGGADSTYTAGTRYVTLKAPEGSILQLKGTVATRAANTAGSEPQDYLAVYDGSYSPDLTDDDKLANSSAKSGNGWRNLYFSANAGQPYDMGTMTSSGQEITIVFHTVAQDNTAYPGLDLTVTRVPIEMALDGMGLGTSLEPYKVATRADLKNLAEYIEKTGKADFYVEQVADIDLKGMAMKPLGSHAHAFSGTYEGGGHTIRNAKIEVDGMAGIFGVVSGTVTRLCVENSTFRYMKRDGRVGGIAARITGKGVISNCFVKNCKIMHNGSTGNSIEEQSSRIGVAGGIASDMFDQSAIKNCIVLKTSITATRTGQICSDTKSGTRIERCYTDGDALTSYDSYCAIQNSEHSIADYRFRYGEVCYMINGNKSNNVTWYQTVGTDPHPVLDDSHGIVYRFENEQTKQTAYVNSTTEPETVTFTLYHNDYSNRSTIIKAYRQYNEEDANLQLSLNVAGVSFDGAYSGKVVRWTEHADDTGASYSSDHLFKPSKDMTLYAQWGSLEFCIPRFETQEYRIPKTVTTLKVYDDGGPVNNYSSNCHGEIKLTLPENNAWQVSGTVTTDWAYMFSVYGPDDYLTILDNNGNRISNSQALTSRNEECNGVYCSNKRGEAKDIGRIIVSNAVSFKFNSNDFDQYAGVDLTIQPLEPPYYIYSKDEFVALIGVKGDVSLGQDIDLGEWSGNVDLVANLDGGAHTITYSSENNCWGLFKNIKEGASVKHLAVSANVQTNTSCGGIAYNNDGTISDCSFRGNINLRSFEGFNDIAGLALNLGSNSVVDHCCATGNFELRNRYNGKVYELCKWNGSQPEHCYRPDRNSVWMIDYANKLLAEYPVYAKGILTVTSPNVYVGSELVQVNSDGKIDWLYLKDDRSFRCLIDAKSDDIRYERGGTDGAYEPWVLPFNYMLNRDLFRNDVEFYRFEKDMAGNIVLKQIDRDENYQVAANEPLIYRSTRSRFDTYEFNLSYDNGYKRMMRNINVPYDGTAATLASRRDMARLRVTYDNITPDKAAKEMMYLWDSNKRDFVLADGTKGVQPFRFYLQYVDKATGNVKKYEDTDWASQQTVSARSLAKDQASRRASLSTLTAEGWQPIILDPRESQKVTAEMLEDYDILCLWDLYDQKADNNQYAVSVIYTPVPAGIELPYAVPLLVRAKHGDAKPLVTEQMARDIDAQLTEAAKQMTEAELEAAFDEIHYWCGTFAGRYDVWQFALPEKDSLLNEYGALTFANNAGDQYFYRVPASDSYAMKPMSYCFTAYDGRSFDNLPLANDRIEIVVIDLPEEVLGVETIDTRNMRDRRMSGNTYNLNGQKVSDSYRGIVIKNGRKIRR